MQVGNLAEWVGAVATAAAVVVALFKEDFVRYLRRPKLKGSISLSPPDCIQGPIIRQRDGFSADCYFLRLWIENSGKTRAETVQVFATKLERKGAGRSYMEVENFRPMNLKWDGGEIFAQGISPTMGKHCNLGHLINPKFRKCFGDDLEGVQEDETIFSLDLEAPPPTKSHLLRPGTYQLLLKIAANNCTVVNKRLELTIRGNWFPERERMFPEGLDIA